MLKIFVLFLLIIAVGCNSDEKKQNELPKNWDMTEVFYDQTPELLEGGYCAYFFRSNNVIADSLEVENDNSIVAMVIEPKMVIGKTKAKIWVEDNKEELVLSKDETKGTQKYTRIFENERFIVTMTMRIVEVIDGMEEEDMLVYSGEMIVKLKATNQEKKFKIKGGC
jgi:hypothetical protein